MTNGAIPVKQTIAELVFSKLDSQAPDWEEVTLTYVADDGIGAVGTLELKVDGAPNVALDLSAETAIQFQQLRSVMAVQGRPLWHSARMTMIGDDGRYDFEFAGTPVTVTPPSVAAAATILLMCSGLLVFGMLVFSINPQRVSADTTAAIAGSVTAALIGWGSATLGAVAGIWLLRSQSRNSRVLATISAAAFAFTCIGFIATVAVPILLWRNRLAQEWFEGPTYLP